MKPSRADNASRFGVGVLILLSAAACGDGRSQGGSVVGDAGDQGGAVDTATPGSTTNGAGQDDTITSAETLTNSGPSTATGTAATDTGASEDTEGSTGGSGTGTATGGSGTGTATGGSGTGTATGGSGTGTATGGSGGTIVSSGDPLDILRQYTPSDPELAEEYEGYLTGELGTLVTGTEGTGSARTITQTIFIPPNTTYDGRGEVLTADAAAMLCDTTEGEQAESQRPFFILAPGASLKNVTFTYPGCEGVHMMGDNVLENIVWEDVGEDAASVRSYFPGGAITIRNCEGHKARDKIFQFNAPCNLLIENFTGNDMGKLVRQNGGTEFEFYVDLNNVTVTAVVSAVVQSDSPICYVRYHNLSYVFTGSGDKSDRVFRDIPAANVTAY